ncbi:hypothetical protein SH1V18_20810 [Vallitalea longa]|uniref:DUF5104 domain-containing protein n=1 Tax=Vallitalea longa TaxID=2936439 RepID=A0A9W5YBG9_9FIRM|nr:DUF5104 domain-containing protein [Vallitalea longa]GKX29601.1 hypothetical protein SH1V18_20810 [Vallitalea longa]
MKKILLILIITLNVVLITSCSISSRSMVGSRVKELNESNDDEIANSTLQKILDAIVGEDEESIKDIFSKQALEEDENFDTEMKYIFDFFSGEVISYENYAGRIVSKKINYGAKIKDIKSFYEVETDEENYLVFIMEYTEDTDHPDNVGVYTLRIIKAEDKETEFTYWQDMAIPGIYMPEEETVAILSGFSCEINEEMNYGWVSNPTQCLANQNHYYYKG